MDIHKICFLCKEEKELTDEHVFPQWMQTKFDLWNKFIVMKDGSKFKYGSLKINCCKECNGVYLSQKEKEISELIKSNNIQELKSIEASIFIWLYKIMYGINYKEMFMKLDKKKSDSEPLVQKEHILNKEATNLFLQSVLGKVKFNDFSPYSLFIFNIVDTNEDDFYYASEPYSLFASIILGNIGIICSFQDDGYIKQEIYKNMGIENMHNIDLAGFGDLSAFVINLKNRMKFLPPYKCSKDKDGVIHVGIYENEEIELFSEFKIEKQIEIMQTMYPFCFESLYKKNEKGEILIKYESPFKYF